MIGVEINPDESARLNSGYGPMYEHGVNELVSDQVRAGRLHATDDVDQAVRGSDIAVITVGTPSAADGAVCSAGVELVLKDIGNVLRLSGQAYPVTVRSTLLPAILHEPLPPLPHA